MKEYNPMEEAFRQTVADKEEVRARVLEQAHREAQPVSAQPHRRIRWGVTVPVAACLTFCLLVNVSATFSQTMSDIPVLGSVARLVTFRSFANAGDAYEVQGNVPELENSGNEALEQKLNPLLEEKLNDLKTKAEEEAEQYRSDFLAMDGNTEENFVPLRYSFDYEVYYQGTDAISFVIRGDKTVTTNTENTYTTLYYYNLDLNTGDELTLPELLGAQWNTVIENEVDRQIRAGGNENLISYYEQFWVNKNVHVDETQMFHLNQDGDVVVTFYEGYVAPLEAGIQEFVIPTP